MNDLDLIRGFLERVNDPDPERVEATWLSLMRGLEVEPTYQPSRRARAPRRWVVPGIAATAVIIAVGLPALLPGGIPGGPGSAEAARVLRRMGAVAAGQPAQAPPELGQYVYTKSKDAQTSLYVSGRGMANFSFTVPTTREAWIGPDGSGRIVRTVGEVTFPSSEDRNAWIAAGSPDLEPGGLSMNELFGTGGLQFLDLANLPTDPDELRAVIEEREIVGGPPGDWETFVIVGDLLRETYAPPALRRALYEVAANLSDVEYLGEVRDAAGRPGLAVANTHNGTQRVMIFDPNTARLLGETELMVDAEGGVEVDDEFGGTIVYGAGEPGTALYSAVYLESGVVDSTDARP